VCATELRAACEAAAGEEIETRVEPAGVTADALVAGDAQLDGWLTIEPWPAMVDEARRRRGDSPRFVVTGTPPLARTPIVVVGVKERMAVLEDECGGSPSWSCIGDVAGRPWVDVGGQQTWGAVRPGHDGPDTSATGLAVLASAVTDFFGTPDISSADFDDDAFRSWFSRLERSVPSFRPRFETMVEDMLVAQGQFDAVGALEADVLERLRRAPARGERLTVLYPAAMTTADAVLALGPGGHPRLVTAVEGAGADALAAVGWRRDADDLPEANGLPRPGVQEALRQQWAGVRR
jgi:hypothetical protein